jgi:hypothetical protein
MFNIRLIGSEAPHSNWSPTVNREMQFSSISNFLTIPTAISSLPETSAGLNKFIEDYKIELDVLTSVHYDTEPKKFELINLRYQLIMNENYNKFYKDVIVFENSFVRFNTTGKLFLSFANAYDILNDKNKGIWQLENIVKIKVLEWFIEDYNKHPENEYFVQYKLPKDYYDKDYLNVFFLFNIPKKK